MPKKKRLKKMMIQKAFRDGLTGRFVSADRAKHLSKKRITKVALEKPLPS